MTEYDDEQKEFLERIMQVGKSAVFWFMKEGLWVFLKMLPGYFAKYHGQGEKARRIIDINVTRSKEAGLTGTDRLAATKIHYREVPEKRIKATILEIPGPYLEPEPNILALVYAPKEDYEQLYYYLSEYYENGWFGLCEQKSDGTHLNYGFSGGDIRTVDQMWQACLDLVLPTLEQENPCKIPTSV